MAGNPNLAQSAVGAPIFQVLPGAKGSQLWLRSCTLVVGTTKIEDIGVSAGLNIWFEVRRSLKAKEPNTLDLKIYNLQDSTRQSIEQFIPPAPASSTPGGKKSQGVPVSLTAGYIGATSQIYLGFLRTGQTMTDGKTTTMELNSGDADKAMTLARTSKTFGSGATAYLVAKQLLSDMGLGLGNIASAMSRLNTPIYSRGVAVKGSSYELLVDLAASCGLEISLQGGVPQWIPIGQPLGGEVYDLSPSTGLLGSPSVDSKGVLQAETEMLPGLLPGMPIQMASKYVQGIFRITSIITKGEARGAEWGHSIEAKRLGLAA
jgi:hypothetical protein